MCHQCNYSQMLTSANVETTKNRLHVLEVIGSNHFPLSADDIFKTLELNASVPAAGLLITVWPPMITMRPIPIFTVKAAGRWTA